MAAALLLLVALAPAVSPDWCAGARAQLAPLLADDAVPTPASVESLLAALPPSIAGRARGDIGRAANLRAAVDTAALAVHAACDARAVDARADADTVREILQDPRFRGLRTDDSFVDKLLTRLWRTLEELLQSDGMQVFAENTRTLYLVGLVVVASVVAARLVRNARLARRAVDVGTPSRMERERERAFSAWRADAVPLVDADPRRAALLLRRALLARVGEIDDDAVRPSRTSSEVLARLPDDVAALVRPPLLRFDRAFYSGALDADVTRALLVDVDEAARALAARNAPRPSGGAR